MILYISLFFIYSSTHLLLARFFIYLFIHLLMGCYIINFWLGSLRIFFIYLRIHLFLVKFSTYIFYLFTHLFLVISFTCSRLQFVPWILACFVICSLFLGRFLCLLIAKFSTYSYLFIHSFISGESLDVFLPSVRPRKYSRLSLQYRTILLLSFPQANYHRCSFPLSFWSFLVRASVTISSCASLC